MRTVIYRELTETSEHIGPLVRDLLKAPQFMEIPGFLPHLEYFPDRRWNRQLLKPYLVRCGYELGGGVDWRSIAPVCAAAELLNISTYQSNAAFDSKYGSVHGPAQFISSAVVRERASQVISEVARMRSPKLLDDCLGLVSESVSRVYLAQFLDLYVLRVPNLDLNFLEAERFEHLYDLRCRHGSGFLIAVCLVLGYKLASDDEAASNVLFDFGLEYGTGLHVVNDMADYIPPAHGTLDTHKGHQDSFSDLREGKVTLPFISLLERVPASERDLLVRCLGTSPDDATSQWIFQLMIDSGSFQHCRRLVKGYYKAAKDFLHMLPKTRARDNLAMISATLRSNKYFHAVRAFESDRTKSIEEIAK